MLCNWKLRNHAYSEDYIRVDDMRIENLLKCFNWHARPQNQYMLAGVVVFLPSTVCYIPILSQYQLIL